MMRIEMGDAIGDSRPFVTRDPASRGRILVERAVRGDSEVLRCAIEVNDPFTDKLIIADSVEFATGEPFVRRFVDEIVLATKAVEAYGPTILYRATRLNAVQHTQPVTAYTSTND